VNDRVVNYLVNALHLEVWGGINKDGTDWQEWELPSSMKGQFAVDSATHVKQNMESRGATCEKSDTYSAVLTLHDRPHELHWVEEVVGELCRVCPRFRFPTLAAQCAPHNPGHH